MYSKYIYIYPTFYHSVAIHPLFGHFGECIPQGFACCPFPSHDFYAVLGVLVGCKSGTGTSNSLRPAVELKLQRFPENRTAPVLRVPRDMEKQITNHPQ